MLPCSRLAQNRMKTLFTKVVVALGALTFLLTSATAETKKPNIIFILADDLGYGEVGCFGQKQIRTPSLDKMAKEGMRFTQAYAGNTVCAPSRCALMTGKHMGHATVRGNDVNRLGANDLTVAKILKDAGYTTGLVGKWGLGEENTEGVPPKQGFDYSYGYLNQVHAHDYYTDYLFRNGERIANNTNDYTHDLFAKESLEFVRREKDKPFFLYLAFTIPHSKINPPSEEPYAKENWPATERKKAAMITRMDRDIGRLFDLLKELKLDENTIVFFSSDNGPHHEGGADNAFFKSAGPLRGIKRDLYEGGFREPTIVRWPGHVKANKVSDHIWGFWDFLPTACDLAGVSAPKDIDGLSIAPTLLRKGKQQEHDYMYWEFNERGFQQAVRMGDWKALRLKPGQPLELYNLKKDLGETKNVAAANPKIVEKIESILKTCRTEYVKKDKGPKKKK
ncbi:MAG: N-acetylgalactosamine-6-sulfatase [Verrucomicrobiales bacterium]|nr:N-acetylgalactosamine-6-sulfatase [Verrucomicrobiales bacterium]